MRIKLTFSLEQRTVANVTKRRAMCATKQYRGHNSQPASYTIASETDSFAVKRVAYAQIVGKRKV